MTPSTATNQLRYPFGSALVKFWRRTHISTLIRHRPQHLVIVLCAHVIGQFWRRNYIHIRIHRRPQHLVIALCARLVGGLAKELHRPTDTPSTATTELRTMCLFRGQSLWRTHILALVRRRLLPISFAIARFLDSPGGGTTRKRVGRVTATHPFPCSSIIQTPPFPVASRSDHRTPYSRDPPHLLFYSSPSVALTMGFPPPPLS